MATEQSHSAETDLDKTDRLPILDGSLFDHDVEDDAVPMDHTAVLPGFPLAAASYPAETEFVRPPGVDLPSLAESVRSVEERIARQNAEYESLARAYERARDVEAASVARASALAVDLAAARAALESEQNRSREMDRTLADRSSLVETARTRVEEALRESERHQIESRTLRDSLAARDSTIAQVLHSLGERDAQLAALQTEHAKVVPALEATSKSSKQLDGELRTTRAQLNALTQEVQTGRETTAALAVQFRRAESEVNAARSELAVTKTQSSSYLELLRTREWRRGFDQNLFRELDAEVGAAHAGHDAAESERDRLQRGVATLEAQLAAQLAGAETERERLSAESTARESALAQWRERGSGDAQKIRELLETAQLSQAEHASQIAALRAEQAAQVAQLQSEAQTHGQDLAVRLAGADTERNRLSAELAARESALAQWRERGSSDAQKIKELLETAQLKEAEQSSQITDLRAEQAVQIAQLQSEAETQEQEMAVLIAHLQEARRPIQSIEADVKRLTDELAAKTAAFHEIEEDNVKLRASLERTKGALEEREFLIRRLERSESNNANVLGRIQTSIERLGAAPVNPTVNPVASPAADWSAELIRVDGERTVTHVLSRRTRIGRASGCELQIDSSSVSRHHALVVVGPREVIIEDLNSTNGVLVNGRKVSRQVLSDGDAVTIGEVQFRYFARPLHHAAEPSPAEGAPATPVGSA
jgi:chromosome segregation ATPase